ALHLAKLKFCSKACVMNKLGKRVAKATSTHIVDRQDGILFSKGNTGVDYHLCPPLHLWVPTLDTGKVEINRARARVNRRGSTASQTDKHGRTTEDDNICARHDISWLLD